MSSGTGGISPTGVVEPPLLTAGGGGGGEGGTFTAVAEVHRSPSMDDEEKLLAQASGQHVVENTDPGKAPAILRHARQQAGNAFGPEESPGRYIVGSVPGTVIDFGSGRTSGQ